MGVLTVTCAAAATGAASAADVPPLVVSEYQTPNGWLLRPAGTQIDTPRAPSGVTVTPDGQETFVVNNGIFDEQVVGIDSATLQKASAPATDLYLGVAAKPRSNAGTYDVWASGGNRNKVWHFVAAGPAGIGTRHVGLAPGTPNNGIPVEGYPGNMVLAGDGKTYDGRLFVAGNMSTQTSGCPGTPPCSVVSVIDVSDPLNRSPAVHAFTVGRDAYGLAYANATRTLYVTNWADETDPARAAGNGTVSVVDATPGSEHEVQAVPVGHHPTGVALSPDGRTLAVANAADDTLSIVSLGPDGRAATATTQSLRDGLTGQRAMSPMGVSFSPDGSLIYVAVAGIDAVEVRTATGAPIAQTVTVGGKTFSVPHTYIPTGWYPTALAVDPAGKRLYVTNLKGIGAGPGLNGDAEPFNGSRTQGTVSAIDIPAVAPLRDVAFQRWTQAVVENNRWAPFYTQTASAASDPCIGAPIPGGGEAGSELLCQISKGTVDPHQLHVVYIVKENKTFDQYFGDIKPDLPGANADPTWLLYGRAVTTNQHELAKRYAINDSFWADGDVSVTGHSITSAGYATDFNEITWNADYDEGLRGHRVTALDTPIYQPQERLVDLFAKDPTLSYRIYSDDVNQGSAATANRIPLSMWGLAPSADNHSRDLDFPDTDRANIFLKGQTISNTWSLDRGGPPPTFGKLISLSDADKQKFTLDAWQKPYEAGVAAGGNDQACQQKMPNLLYMALPVNHTLGLNPMNPTPASMVADNDYAVGKVVAALSRTSFWKNTLVMISEDDTQAAGDHVDAHRTYLLTAGGLARPFGPDGEASHQPGSFPALLKTIEVMFKLPPITVYDKAAVPMSDMVVDSLDEAAVNAEQPYTAVRPPTPFLRNPEGTTLAQLSTTMNWKLDRQNPYLLRDLLYASIRHWQLPARDVQMLRAGRLGRTQGPAFSAIGPVRIR
jgi:DNA-binding beta-propeller fold protein YncE